jgi:hypothetical protein
MKRLVALTLALVLAACAQTGGEFVQEETPPDPDVKPNPAIPDPIITEPVNGRYVGFLRTAVTGPKTGNFELDSIFEYREKQAGRLIGYSQMHDRLDPDPKSLFVNYWADGKRIGANIEFNVEIVPIACKAARLKGKLDTKGSVTFPKTIQKVTCGSASLTVTTDAAVFVRKGPIEWTWWGKIEAWFAK